MPPPVLPITGSSRYCGSVAPTPQSLLPGLAEAEGNGSESQTRAELVTDIRSFCL
jgi:hypothetical protein